MKQLFRIGAFSAGALALLFAIAPLTAWSQPVRTALFKVITDKDDIIIGLTAAELQALGGPETSPAGRIAQALASKKALTVWQYAVKHGSNGELQLAPLHQVGLLASNAVRVEPYSTPLAVVDHQ
jgi:hypothetical protein